MNEFSRVLAIETSCDDTSVALVTIGGYVEFMLSQSQDDNHKPFGGVVPEVASRAHSEKLLQLVDKVMQSARKQWKEVDGIVVTNRPGLIGSLLVGLVTAKTLSMIYKIPFLGVNHIEGHVWAPFLKDEPDEFKPQFQKFLSLAVSGGHTQLILVEGVGHYKILGKTLDDAAGEAFDKFAKLIGLGYPGGHLVDQMAQGGQPNVFKFPRPMAKSDNLDFSFSGLKTAAHQLLTKMNAKEIEDNKSHLCASFQDAIVDSLVIKVEQALNKMGDLPLTITGGVSANSRLREKMEAVARSRTLPFLFPKLKYCTDNAAMIGLAGLQLLNNGQKSELNLGPYPHSLAEDFYES
jgi:N6-L-threonylcarbamoyladenine synthase